MEVEMWDACSVVQRRAVSGHRIHPLDHFLRSCPKIGNQGLQNKSSALPTIISFTDDEFHKTCFASFDQMRRKGKLCDITLLSAASRRFAAHKIVLAATIPFFNGMFLSNMAEVNKTEIPMLGLDASALEAFVSFAYTGSIQITPYNVQSLLIGASFLQLTSIRNICCRYIGERLSPSTVLTVRSFALSFMCNNLLLACENYIFDHFDAVSQTDAFLSLDGAELMTLLESDDLCVASEENLFQTVMKWVEHEDKDEKNGDCTSALDLLPSAFETQSLPFPGFEYGVSQSECVSLPSTWSDLKRPLPFGFEPPNSTASSNLHVAKDVRSRIDLLPELLKRIRLPLIPAHYISTVISKHRLIRESIRCRDLLDEVRDMLILRNRPSSGSFSCKPRRGQEVFGIIYAVGGLTVSGDSHGIVETYHPSLGRWELAEQMPSQRSRIGVVTLHGLLYAIGGFDGTSRLKTTELYDPKTKVWKTVAPMNFARSALGAAALDGRLYVCGGYDGTSSLRTCEMYDPKQDKWLIIPSMNEPRSAGGLVALSNGCLYAVGGHNGLAIYSSTECYNPRAAGPTARPVTTDAQSSGWTLHARLFQSSPWQPMGRMIHRRCRHGVAALRNRIVVAGGYNGVNFLRSVEVFDPTAGPDVNGLMGQWTEITSLSVPRSRVGLAVTGGRLYAIGGYDGMTHLRTVECFQPISNTFSACDRTPVDDGSRLTIANQNVSSSGLSHPDSSVASSSDEDFDGDTDSASTESTSAAISHSQDSQTISQLEANTVVNTHIRHRPSTAPTSQGAFANWQWVPAASLIAHEGWVGVGVLPLDEVPGEHLPSISRNLDNTRSSLRSNITINNNRATTFRPEDARFRRGRTA
ncbi:BTB/POZ domain protein [Opisthorchis viverrini]|uniref:BTB/POZ domain protein n=1 Tax=Opisthorchis viverrini TaxID=6198 RepID=A0A1S8X6L3_OPIVI|nr:BTB/POZ domain protein [Opisthorchis viverrini]